MTDERDLRFKALREPFDHVQKLNKGTFQIDYIGHGVVTSRLLEVDPTYTFEPLTKDGLPIVVLDGLPQGDNVGVWARLTILNTVVVEFCSGKHLLEAYSRCLCRCAMRRGVALDLWITDDEFKEARVEKNTMKVPRSWAEIGRWYEANGGEKASALADAFLSSAAYHVYGKTSIKALKTDARAVMMQKSAGVVVWLAENEDSPIGSSPSPMHYARAWATQLDGAMLEVPDAPAAPPGSPDVDPPLTEEEEEVERLARIAEQEALL